MIKKVLKTVEEYGMLYRGDCVTVGLSGGADSVCLLLILLEIAEEYELKIEAFHLNHQLRGEESERDEAFVKALCERLSVPLTVERADIAAEAQKRGESIELCARNIRYGLMKKYAKGVVALAHTMSDNLETVIYNLARGGGVKGLSGIPPVRDIYIRPLIGCSREEIENYLAERGESFVTDSSNLTDDYSRNFIRHNLVPLMKKLNPSVEQTVATNSAAAREDAAFLDSVAAKIYAIASKDDRIDAEMLKVQPAAVAKRVLASLYGAVSGDMPDSLHINRMYGVLQSGVKASLPKGLAAYLQDGFFIIAEDKKAVSDILIETKISYHNLEKENIVYNLLLKKAIDCDKIRGKLTVRTRREGDVITLPSRKCSKSLKKLFNEMKIPTAERDLIPVIADDEGVVFVYSVGADKRVVLDRDSKNAAVFEFTKLENSGETV